jgi:hypothetical protein
MAARLASVRARYSLPTAKATTLAWIRALRATAPPCSCTGVRRDGAAGTDTQSTRRCLHPRAHLCSQMALHVGALPLCRMPVPRRCGSRSTLRVA